MKDKDPLIRIIITVAADVCLDIRIYKYVYQFTLWYNVLFSFIAKVHSILKVWSMYGRYIICLQKMYIYTTGNPDKHHPRITVFFPSEWNINFSFTIIWFVKTGYQQTSIQ